jgi:hypothetical protein
MPLPPGYNQAVMRVMRDFAEEVKHRESERKYSTSLTHGQQYVQGELGLLFRVTKDEDEKTRINLLEKAFTGPVTGAIRTELNRIRRNAVTGEALLKTLSRLHQLHNMGDWEQRRRTGNEQAGFPRVVCSEGLV